MRIAARVPHALIALRVILAPIVFWLIVQQRLRVAATLYVVALLSDIFDGMVARRVGVATLQLRLADSFADIWLYLWLAFGVAIELRELTAQLTQVVVVVAIVQTASWMFALVRFRRWSCYHSLLSKLAGLALGVGVLALLLSGTYVPMAIALWLLVAAAAEEIAMTAVLPRYHHDVRTLRVALRLRRQDLVDAGRGTG